MYFRTQEVEVMLVSFVMVEFLSYHMFSGNLLISIVRIRLTP